MMTPGSWDPYVSWLAQHAPAAHANLAGPASADHLDELERGIGQPLPAPLRSLLGKNDGERDLKGCPVLPGLHLLSTQAIAKEWNMWAKLRRSETPEGLESLDAACRALDPGVRDVYTHPGWIPLFRDEDRSDYLGADLAPTQAGTSGQIINFGRDEERHFVAFVDLEACLAFFLAEADAGRVQVVEREGRSVLRHSGGNVIDVLRERRER